jgi:hypothetical protein
VTAGAHLDIYQVAVLNNAGARIRDGVAPVTLASGTCTRASRLLDDEYHRNDAPGVPNTRYIDLYGPAHSQSDSSTRRSSGAIDLIHLRGHSSCRLPIGRDRRRERVHGLAGRGSPVSPTPSFSINNVVAVDRDLIRSLSRSTHRATLSQWACRL